MTLQFFHNSILFKYGISYFAIFVILISVGIYNQAYAQNADEVLTVIFIELDSAGDSTLIIFPNGKSMLIDGGYKQEYSNIKKHP